MVAAQRPVTPDALIQELSRIIPAFASEWAQDYGEAESAPNFHQVMHTFTYVFGVARPSLSSSELRSVADLVNACVSSNDDLENAVSTCFLEHLHQIEALRALWPYLSERARRECHV